MARRRFTVAFTVVTVALLLLSAGVSSGHPIPDQDRIMNTVLRWADGFTNGDPHLVAPLLHENFRAIGQDITGRPLNREAYLKLLGSKGQIPIRVTLRYAFHEAEGVHATVRPVVTFLDAAPPMAHTIKLAKVGEEWRITEIAADADLPPELTGELPEHFELQRVGVHVADTATGKPVAVRVNIRDSQGRYWPPEGHMKNIRTGWRQDVGGDVWVGGATYAYVQPDFGIPLPTGEYEMEVLRGIEYVPEKVRFDVTAGKVTDLEVRLTRWSNVRKDGWYSGDTHTHFLDPNTGIIEAQAEDLNVLNILVTKWGELITNVEHFTGAPSPLSTRNHIVFFGEESRHGFLGHTILLGIKKLVYPLTWGGPTEGIYGGHDYPPMAHQADAAHSHGGFVTWAHFPRPGGELAVDLALGKIDSVDLMTWGDAIAGVAEGVPSSADTWYRFLNCGLRIPATAGTDKMLNTQVVGSVRTYVKVPGEFSYAAWLDGIRDGRTFVTTGPMLKFEADGHEVGDEIAARAGDTIRVRAEVSSRIPVDWIEIVMGGEVVARKDNTSQAGSLILETDVSAPKSTWVAARAYSPRLQPNQSWTYIGVDGIPLMAHTSPIYISVDGGPTQSPDDAEVLMRSIDGSIEWVRTRARYMEESQRQEVIDLYERARRVYLEQTR
jgi:hypothetical protein